jgi:hypothetical protein
MYAQGQKIGITFIRYAQGQKIGITLIKYAQGQKIGTPNNLKGPKHDIQSLLSILKRH